MDKLKMHSPDITQQNIDKLLELFPNCKTEKQDANGEMSRGIDFDLLKQELSKNIVEGPKERYQLNWPGKKEALITANAPIAKTLRPCREESVDFDSTENLFIEGDNLEALKLLQETYLGKVKMIYIDPPYNTGKDFVYSDNFTVDKDEYDEASGQRDEEGGRLVANPDSSGRYHSDWLSMIYPRLKLARNLLCEDGVIFVSIDQNEVHNLRKICDEVFGESKFCAAISRATGTRMGVGSSTITNELDYILIYSKSSDAEFEGLAMTQEELKIYDHEDEGGKYLLRSLRRTGGENRREDRPSMYFPVTAPDGSKLYPIAPTGYESRWVCGQDTYNTRVKDEMIVWKEVEKSGEKKWQVYQKHYVGKALKQPSNLWNTEDGNKKATKEVNNIFDGKKVFDHPKPVGLMQKIVALSTTGDDIVMDFFAGSGTTAHAVMAQNELDYGKRKFVIIQLPELLDESNRAQQIGIEFCSAMGLKNTVAELTKERIRRAGAKIKQKKLEVKDLDTGFRVLKIDSSNMNEVHYTPDTVSKGDLFNQVEHIKTDRSSEDLLFQVMLDWGVDLSLPIRKETIEGKEVYFVNDDDHAPCDLVACFDKGTDEGLIEALAAKAPLRVVFRDDGFVSDSVKINVEQIFKQLAPATDIKAI